MLLLLVWGFVAGAVGVGAQPIALHPDNPHYFLFRGEPTVLVTSAEHYGAVVNGDFDYETYLAALAEDGLNYTRVFAGTYFEPPGAFGIRHNTLAPRPEAVVAPWPRAIGATGPFDLDRWNEAYFERLTDFVRTADTYGIVVEVTFFSSIYGDAQWAINPFNPANNVNDTGNVERHAVHTLDNGPILAYQERVVARIVEALNDFDNVFYEIQNEPWADNGYVAGVLNPGVPSSDASWQGRIEYPTDAALAWQAAIIDVIRETEEALPKKHLIAENFVNFGYPLYGVDPRLSILNFHYATPDAVEMNLGWDRVLGLDETGFAGTADSTYRVLAWRFMMAGGGLYNNLDYSFTVEHPGGAASNDAPGGGGTTLRNQLGSLKQFLDDMPFVEMTPDARVVVRAPGALREALVDEGRSYAVYLAGRLREDLVLDVPAGTYDIWWIDVVTGRHVRSARLTHEGGLLSLAPPSYGYDVAVRVERADAE
ncbi:MAG: hypothetical protein WD021_06330 [Rhodothermales bacterium]